MIVWLERQAFFCKQKFEKVLSLKGSDVYGMWLY